MFIPGAGTELYRGVGAIVLFGILSTAIITLTFLPALTTLVMDVGLSVVSAAVLPSASPLTYARSSSSSHFSVTASGWTTASCRGVVAVGAHCVRVEGLELLGVERPLVEQHGAACRHAARASGFR